MNNCQTRQIGPTAIEIVWSVGVRLCKVTAAQNWVDSRKLKIHCSRNCFMESNSCVNKSQTRQIGPTAIEIVWSNSFTIGDETGVCACLENKFSLDFKMLLGVSLACKTNYKYEI